MSFRNLDLNLLRVFDEVMQERNLSRAANHLAMTQPAVSNAIQRLRDSLGDALFVRIASGVKPTPFAERVWPVVRNSLAQLQVNLLPDAFSAQEARHQFRIAMADATAAVMIPKLVQLIRDEAPLITLRTLPLTTRDPRSLLEQDAMDIAIGHFPKAVMEIEQPDHQQSAKAMIDHQRLYSGEYVVVMRRDHPLATRALTLDLFCAADHLLVSFSGRPYGFTDEALAALGRKRKILVTVNQFFTAGKVVTQSDLLTVLPLHFVPATGFAELLAVRPMPMPIDPVHVDMLWHRRHQRHPAHVWLRGLVNRAATELRNAVQSH